MKWSGALLVLVLPGRGRTRTVLKREPRSAPRFRTRAPPCTGGFAGYRLDLESISIAGRLGACTSTFENAALTARTNEYAVGVTATHVWDLPFVSAYAGLGLGATMTHQSFETRGNRPIACRSHQSGPSSPVPSTRSRHGRISVWKPRSKGI